MKVIAKVECTGVSTHNDYYQKEKVISRDLDFQFVWHGGDPKHPNRKFWEATPSGSIRMLVVNPEAGILFEPQKEYYLIFTDEKPDGIES